LLANILKKKKGALKGAFLLVLSLILVSCSNTPKKEVETKNSSKLSKVTESEVFTSKNKSSEIKYDSKSRTIESDTFKLQLKEVSKKEDIDGKKSWFIFAEITNLSEEVFLPEVIWNTHLRFSENKDGLDSLYSNVLPKKDLDGSDYKTAIDNMSKEIKPHESAQVGSLYNLPTDGNVYQSILDNDMAPIYISMLKL
jgi:hypothetical protein